jgi:hypothetical protein
MHFLTLETNPISWLRSYKLSSGWFHGLLLPYARGYENKSCPARCGTGRRRAQLPRVASITSALSQRAETLPRHQEYTSLFFPTTLPLLQRGNSIHGLRDPATLSALEESQFRKQFPLVAQYVGKRREKAGSPPGAAAAFDVDGKFSVN